MADTGAAYAAFIEAELKAEHDRRIAVDARAAGVATTSSAFIALAGALSILVTGMDHKFSNAGARGVLVSMASFLLAAIIALVASGARTHEVASSGTLEVMLGAHWSDDVEAARHAVATANAKGIRSLRCGNSMKARQLAVAHVFQVSAVLGLVVTLGFELRGYAR